MVNPLKFGTHLIGDGHPVYIIAEIGVNHEGSVETCAKMIEMAAAAGAHAIKLQTCSADENYVPGTESHALFSACELSQDETAQMFIYARSLNLDPFTTCPDPVSLAWVDRLNPAGHKISSGMMTNPVIIRKTCETGRPVLMSTGLATQEQIDQSVKWVTQYGSLEQFALFQCTSLYPAPNDQLHLHAIRSMSERYGVNVGFSDHTDGTEAAAFAVCAGAKMIEKHFTLDKRRAGYDHRLSLTPAEFREMVKSIHNAESMLGQTTKTVVGELAINAQKYLRTIVARRNISKGEIFTEENIALKRPLPDKRGLDPKHFYEVLGRQANKAIDIHAPIQITDIS